MSYATGTTHYNLPQTVGTDKRDWTDTNEAFSAVDTALYGAVQDAETATSGIQTLNTAVDTINGKLATDEGNISTLSGKVSTLESTVSGHTSAIADVRSDLQDNIESRKEASATSTHAYSIGDTFYYNDVLYKATANIGVGDTIVPNTNCTGITVMSEIQSQTAPTAAQVSYDNTSSGLTADDVQEAIDELNSRSTLTDSTESIIGTYNGETLYRKVIKVTSPTSGIIDAVLTKSYVKDVVKLNGSFTMDNTSIRSLPWFIDTTERIILIIGSTGLEVSVSMGTHTVTNMIVIVEYTKQ